MSHPRTTAAASDTSASDTSADASLRTSAPSAAPARSVSRRRLLQGSAVLGLAAGATALDLTSLTPTERALADGTVDLDLLYIGAHPDDEAWTLAALGQWNEFEGQRAGVITVTRGEGGGNAVGLEEGPPLGLLRETEERTAVGYAGIEHVFNLDSVDFFYTLSAPLSYEVWGGAEVLSRVIRVVRATRPEVIVTMNPSAVQGNHGNHQQAAMFAVEAYLLAGREDVFPEHFEEGLAPFTPSRLLRSGSDGSAPTGPDAVAEGFEPVLASDVVFGAWNGTPSERHGKRWSAVRDDSVHAYRTQGWHVNPPSPTDPEQIPATWFTLIDSRTPLVDPTSGGTAALQGATLPIQGGLPLGTTLEVTADRFEALPGEQVEVEVVVGAAGSALSGVLVELEVPTGWSAGRRRSLGTIPAQQQATATFSVRVGEGASPGEHVLLRARVTTRRGGGENVLPLRTAGPVEAGIADRPEIAAFLEWTRELGMERLDALVPTRRSLGQGGAEEFEVVVRNHSGTVQDAEVVLELPEEDNKQRFRTDSIEIMIDPRGTSDHTATTFILGVLPGTDDGDGGVGGPVAGRDHDNRQGPIAETAPGVQVAALISDPYEGYVVEVTIPLEELPDGIDPRRMGFNVVVYDSDTQDRTGQSRIGWSTFPGVQADPFRWGVLELPELEAGPEAPVEPRIPDTAARSVESPASILQAAEDGVGLGGEPALEAGTLRLDRALRRRGEVSVQVRSTTAGTRRAYAWDGERIVGGVDSEEMGAVRQTLRIPLADDVAEDAALWIAASLENEEGAAAAAMSVR